MVYDWSVKMENNEKAMILFAETLKALCKKTDCLGCCLRKTANVDGIEYGSCRLIDSQPEDWNIPKMCS